VPERQINEHWLSLERYLDRWHSPRQAHALRWLTGLGYALATVAAEIGLRLPETVRPAAAASWRPDIYRLHVRNAFRGVKGSGLRDLAAEWNGRHGAVPEEASRPPNSVAGS
jgi:hypothetical protein